MIKLVPYSDNGLDIRYGKARVGGAHATADEIHVVLHDNIVMSEAERNQLVEDIRKELNAPEHELVFMSGSARVVKRKK